MKNYRTETLTFTGYFANIFNSVFSVMKGMWITFKYVWAHKPVSIEYPEVREVLPENSRHRLFNNVDDCISCTQCANICPVDCIYISANKRDKDAEEKKASKGNPIRLDLTQFTIDEALCCYCGLCTTVCPTECLTHSTDYEFSTYDLGTMMIDYLDEDVREWKHRIVK